MQHAAQHGVPRATPATPSRCSCRARPASGIMGLYDPATFRCGATNPTPSPTGTVEGNPVTITTEFDGLGVHAPLPQRRRHASPPSTTTRSLRRRRGLRDRPRRPERARVRDRSDREPGLQLVLRGRHAGDGVRRQRPRAGRQVHRHGGNDFWGVEQFTTADGERLIAGSDRDAGLYLFRYTGPGAPVRPACANASAATSAGTPVDVPLSCSDANGNPLTLRASQPARGAVSVSGTTLATRRTPAPAASTRSPTRRTTARPTRRPRR